MEDVPADSELFLDGVDGDADIDYGLTSALAVGVVPNGLLQPLAKADVVDDKAAWFGPEHPIHAGDGLHQGVALHGFVDVKRVERWAVKAGQPHVAHDDHPQRVDWVLQATLDDFVAAFVADVRSELRRVRGASCDDDLEGALFVVLVMPGGPKIDDLGVQGGGDPAAHADDHRLGFHGVESLLEVLDDFGSDRTQPLIGADQGLDPRPPRFHLPFDASLLGLSDVLQRGVGVEAVLRVHVDP